MRKRLSTVIFSLLLFVACVSTTSSSPERQNNKINDYVGSVYVTDEDNCQTRIKVYRYKVLGHLYQYHYISAGRASHGGPIHDPDCLCLKKYEIEKQD